VQLFICTIKIWPAARGKNNDPGGNSNPLTRPDQIEYAAVI
jgi:hypothetical protein